MLADERSDVLVDLRRPAGRTAATAIVHRESVGDNPVARKVADVDHKMRVVPVELFATVFRERDERPQWLGNDLDAADFHLAVREMMGAGECVTHAGGILVDAMHRKTENQAFDFADAREAQCTE